MKISKLVLNYDVTKEGKASSVVFKDVRETVGVPNRFLVNNSECIQGIFNSANVFDDKGEEIFHFEKSNLVTIHKYMKYFYITFFTGSESEQNKMIIFDDVYNQEFICMKAPWDSEDKIMIRLYSINEERRSDIAKDRPALYSAIENLKTKLSIGDLNSVESNLLNTLQLDLYKNKDSYFSIENGFEFEFAKRDENDTSLEYVLNTKISSVCSTDDYIIAIYQRCEKTKQWQVKHVTILRNLYDEDKKIFNDKKFSFIINLNNLIDYLVPIDNCEWVDLDTFDKFGSMDTEESSNKEIISRTKPIIRTPWDNKTELVVGIYHITSNRPTPYSEDIRKFDGLYQNPTKYFNFINRMIGTSGKFSVVENFVLDHIKYGFFSDDSMKIESIQDRFDIAAEIYEEEDNDYRENSAHASMLVNSMKNKGETSFKLKFKYNEELPLGKYLIMLFEKGINIDECNCIYCREYLNIDQFYKGRTSASLIFNLNLILPFSSLATRYEFEKWNGVDLERFMRNGFNNEIEEEAEEENKDAELDNKHITLANPFDENNEYILAIYKAYGTRKSSRPYSDDCKRMNQIIYGLKSNLTKIINMFVDVSATIEESENKFLNQLREKFFDNNEMTFGAIDLDAVSAKVYSSAGSNLVLDMHSDYPPCILSLKHTKAFTAGKLFITIYSRNKETGLVIPVFCREYLSTERDEYIKKIGTKTMDIVMNLAYPFSILTTDNEFEDWNGFGEIPVKGISNETEYQIAKANQEDGNVNHNNEVRIGVKLPDVDAEDVKKLQELQEMLYKIEEVHNLLSNYRKQLYEHHKNSDN